MDAWNQTNYELSLTSRCWAYTPYDGGWESCAVLREDDALRGLCAEELALAAVPIWARDILERQLTYLPGCPHATFPLPFLDVFNAIGARACLPFVHSCYTIPADRKEQAVLYINALVDWLAKRPSQHPSIQLQEILGAPSETTSLLVKRLVHRLKWWCKSMTWDNDARDQFYQGESLGDTQCQGDHYGNPQFHDPYWTELQAPAAQELEAQLSATCPEWPWLRDCIHSTWLCGPKAFRYVERIVWYIAHLDQAQELAAGHRAGTLAVPSFLDCSDTCPDMAEIRAWFADALAACRLFRTDRVASSPRQANLLARLGDHGPVKAWLVGLFARKLALMPYARAG